MIMRYYLCFVYFVWILKIHSTYSENPAQIHISLTADLNIIVTWNTNSSTPPSSVKFGTSKSDLALHAPATQQIFTIGSPVKRSQYIHRATLINLKPEKTYYYKCGSQVGWSNIFSFNSVGKNSSFAPRFAIFGDFGLLNPQSLPRIIFSRLIADTKSGLYDVILHVGDLAYDMDTNDSMVGDQFMEMIQPVAASVPYMTCPGNHENNFPFNFSNYKARFSMPGRTEDMFYSFNIGPAHIISINTEFYYFIFYGISQVWKQYRWLEKDLQEASKSENRQERPWIIVMGHRPMYCSNADHDDCTHGKRDLVRRGYGMYWGLEKLFYKHGVDLNIWAHEHSYERLWPIYDMTVRNGSLAEPYTNPKAPVHVITGSAGCQERHDNFIPEHPEWSAFRSSDYGFSRMTVHNKSHISFEQISDDKSGPSPSAMESYCFTDLYFFVELLILFAQISSLIVLCGCSRKQKTPPISPPESETLEDQKPPENNEKNENAKGNIRN